LGNFLFFSLTKRRFETTYMSFIAQNRLVLRNEANPFFGR
jgi:hypothetical protein